MGWAGGSSLMDAIIKTVKKNVPSDGARHAIYMDAIVAFEMEDADTLGECLDNDTEFDRALRELSPGVYDEDRE